MAVYLITGASSGIGKALSEEAIKRGNVVYGLARREEILNELAEKQKDRFVPFVCDVTDKEQVHQVCAGLPEVPDVVIMNAGVGLQDNYDRFDLSAHEKTMAVNYFGAIYFVDALYGKFAERKRGTFVGISSLASYRGLPGSSSYSASKGALSNALDSFRLTYRNSGVDFITVHPGFVDTPINAKNKFPMPFLWSAEKAAKYILDKIAKGKLIIGFPLPMRMLLTLAWILPPGIWRATAKR